MKYSCLIKRFFVYFSIKLQSLKPNLLKAVEQPQPVAFKKNDCSHQQPHHSPGQQQNGKSARANRRRRRRRNKQQQNSQQPDAFREPEAQLTPSTSSSTPHSAPDDSHDLHLNTHSHSSNTQADKMPARFAEEVITAEPAQLPPPIGPGWWSLCAAPAAEPQR